MMRNITASLLLFSFGLIFFTLISSTSLADSITKIQGTKVLIDIDSEELATGDKVFAIDDNGKKKAIIEITKVKGTKALGEISKGKANTGMSVIKAGGTSSSEPKKSAGKSGKHGAFSAGILVGLGMDNMTVATQDAQGNTLEKVKMSGNGYSAKAFADYEFSESIGVRALFGLEKFYTKGTSTLNVCDAGTDCKADIQYLTIDGLLRYFILHDDFKVWVGLGGGFWMPGARKTNTLDETSIGTTTAFYGSLGFDWNMDSMFVPFQVDYMMLPSSAQVSASGIAVRAGIGFRF